MEVLHTLLLGPYEYFLKAVMGRLSSSHRLKVLACISSFPFSGCDMHLSRNIAKYHKSFVACDFKALAQLALFEFHPYLTPGGVVCTFKV